LKDLNPIPLALVKGQATDFHHDFGLLFFKLTAKLDGEREIRQLQF
jgi:hypothetical protein